MIISSNEKRAFIDSIISSDLLADAICWISGNLMPDEVFSYEDLEGWAEENGYIKEEE